MISNKYQKLIGCSFIVSATLFFYPFLDMSIRAAIVATDLSLEYFLYTAQLFFFDVGFSIFNYPGLVLLILGIYFLNKTKVDKN